MAFVNMFWRHGREIIAIFVVYMIYRILVRINFIKWLKNFVNPQEIKKTIPTQAPTLLDKAKKIITELYFCSILVLLAYFIYAQLPQVSTVTDFTTIGKFLFMPPLKYLIIFQVAVGLILGLVSLPHMTLEKIITPFGHYGVQKKIEEVKIAVEEEVEWVTAIYRIRFNMINVATKSDFGIFTSKTQISEAGLGGLITYIQGCYNAIFGDDAVNVYAVPIYGGTLDLNNPWEIPSMKIIEAFNQKKLVSSDDGILPAEIAVPLLITDKSYVVVYLFSKIIPLNNEDGETISVLWRFIRAIEMGMNEK
ncbi:MAG TPA: hypothetical protein VIM51_05350 [Desulfosporosinus sp.]